MSLAAQSYSQKEIYQWLERRAHALGIQVKLNFDGAKLEKERLYLPAYIENGGNAYERAAKLQDLEDSWNHQEPQPEPQIFLAPARNTSIRQSMRQVALDHWEQAIQHKRRALEAYGSAETEESQRFAREDLQAAELAEEEALREAELLIPRNERVS